MSPDGFKEYYDDLISPTNASSTESLDSAVDMPSIEAEVAAVDKAPILMRFTLSFSRRRILWSCFG